jgi:protoporphyrinogen oxidase
MTTTVVVGGGTAGLAAAFTLEKAGADYLVLEKGEVAGGRIRGAVRDGFILDLGAQFFFPHYHATFDIMRKLGTSGELKKFIEPTGVGFLRDNGVHPFYVGYGYNFRHPLNVLKFGALSRRGIAQALRLLARLFLLAKKLDFDDAEKAIGLDSTSFADYSLEHFGEEILEYIIQPLAGCLTLGEPEEISAAYGLGLFKYILPGMYTTAKGIGYLAESLARSVPNLRLNAAVSAIVLEGGKVKGVRIANGKQTESIECDNVICCTQADQAAALLPDLPKSMTGILEGIRYSACTHVMLATAEKHIEKLWAIVTPRREGLCLSGFSENANKHPSYAPPGAGITHAFTFGDYAREMLDMDDAEVQSRVTRDIQSVIPGFPDEPLFREIFRWPQAVCLSSPGQIAAVKRLKAGLGEYRGLHLAGEYLGMPSVEAAIYTGVRAAERVLAR